MKLLLNKTNKNLGVIRRLGKTLPLDILLIIYNTLIAPYFEYCNMAWASYSTVIFNRLFCVQKKVLRILAGKQWNEHSAPLFKEMNILTLRDINTLQVACFLYKAVNN